MVAGVGVCFAGGGGGGALTNVYTGLIIHTDSPPPSYTYTTLPPHTTHLYTIYTSDPGLPARSAMAEMKYQTPGCEGRGYQLDMGTKLLKVTCHHSKQVAWVSGTKSWQACHIYPKTPVI